MKDCWENLWDRSLENRLDRNLLKWFGYMPWGGAVGWYLEISFFCDGWYQVKIWGDWSCRVSLSYFMFWSRRHWNVVGEGWIHPCLPDLAQCGISFSMAPKGADAVSQQDGLCWDRCTQPPQAGSDLFCCLLEKKSRAHFESFPCPLPPTRSGFGKRECRRWEDGKADWILRAVTGIQSFWDPEILIILGWWNHRIVKVGKDL